MSPAGVRPSSNAGPKGVDWEILLEIAERLGGGASGIGVIDKTIRLARKLGLRWTPKASVDALLRLGPHGDRYLPWSSGLCLKRLMATIDPQRHSRAAQTGGFRYCRGVEGTLARATVAQAAFVSGSSAVTIASLVNPDNLT